MAPIPYEGALGLGGSTLTDPRCYGASLTVRLKLDTASVDGESDADAGDLAMTTPVRRSAAEPAVAAEALVSAVEAVIHGRHAAVELALAAVVSGGHVLVEDAPGSGKTT